MQCTTRYWHPYAEAQSFSYPVDLCSKVDLKDFMKNRVMDVHGASSDVFGVIYEYHAETVTGDKRFAVCYAR